MRGQQYPPQQPQQPQQSQRQLRRGRHQGRRSTLVIQPESNTMASAAANAAAAVASEAANDATKLLQGNEENAHRRKLVARRSLAQDMGCYRSTLPPDARMLFDQQWGNRPSNGLSGLRALTHNFRSQRGTLDSRKTHDGGVDPLSGPAIGMMATITEEQGSNDAGTWNVRSSRTQRVGPAPVAGHGAVTTWGSSNTTADESGGTLSDATSDFSLGKWAMEEAGRRPRRTAAAARMLRTSSELERGLCILRLFVLDVLRGNGDTLAAKVYDRKLSQELKGASVIQPWVSFIFVVAFAPFCFSARLVFFSSLWCLFHPRLLPPTGSVPHNRCISSLHCDRTVLHLSVRSH